MVSAENGEMDTNASESEDAERPPDSDIDDDDDSFKTAESDEDEIHADDPSPLRDPFAGLANERDPYSHLTSLQRDILLYLYSFDTEEDRERGVHVVQIVRYAQSKDADATSDDVV